MSRYKKKRMWSFCRKSLNRNIAAGIISTFVCLLFQCVFNGPADEQPLTMKSLDANEDTLSVFPQLRFVFSQPLADSSVPVTFSPAISAQYGAYLNLDRDTLTVDVMEMLEGNTRYVLRLEKQVTSISGTVSDLSHDSTVFFTFPCEQESNDNKNIADTLSSVIFGCISDVSDLDVFVCDKKNIQAVYLQSIDCRDSFFVENSLSSARAVNGAMQQTDTILIPENDSVPIFLFVRSGIKGFEGNYKLGVINRNSTK
jgi:hypothetical protein